MPKQKNAKKCKTCAYALGYVKTLICPCPKCVGKVSIFGNHPTISIDTVPEKAGDGRNFVSSKSWHGEN